MLFMIHLNSRGQVVAATVSPVSADLRSAESCKDGYDGGLRPAGLGMGERGQGFDVFKLLIAAVVAGAILLILMQTLQVLPQLGNREPNEVASETVKTQINNSGLPKTVSNVTFKTNDALSSKTIADKSKALSTEQICVKTTTSTPNLSRFTATDGKTVEYTGSFNQQVRLVVICDSHNELQEDIDSFGSLTTLGVTLDSEDVTVGDETVEIPECPEPATLTSRYCLVAVVSDQ